MRTKDDILRKFKEYGYLGKEVVLSLDEFFINNDNFGSIGVNIYPDQPPPSKFYEIFKRLIDQSIADFVYVRITDIDEPEDWFFSDTIYVVGSVTSQELQDIIKDLMPFEIAKGWRHKKPMNIQSGSNGKNIFSVIWD